MAANEIANALLAGGVVRTSATPANNSLYEAGCWGLTGVTRLNTGQYQVALEQPLVDSGAAATGIALVTQKSGTAALVVATVNAAGVLLETFARASGAAADVEGSFSLSVLKSPTAG